MRFDTLDQWLEWQTVLHASAIDLGLERVQQVAGRMGLGRIARQVITVAGTNGKGSTVAGYEIWLRRAGYTVASYTSPHLLKYNERIKYNLEPVSDAELCSAFESVEAARGDTSLTYFEYGTLAALHLFQQWQPDYAILEVGLGGRLDAVNIIDADLVHLTPIGIDHQAWLGDDREQIGFEKAGVLRDGIPVVLNDPDPPRSVLEEIERHRCSCMRLGRDYQLTGLETNRPLWQSRDLGFPLDNIMPGAHQALNLAGVVAGLSRLIDLSAFDPDELRNNFHGAGLAGRLQQIDCSLPCRLFADVGHNPDAARALAASLDELKSAQGRLVVLLGMLEDKQPELFVEALSPVVDSWWLTGLDCDRGLSVSRLQSRIGAQVKIDERFDNVAAALDHALSSLGNQDIMLVTGSFVTVEQLLRAVPDPGKLNKYGSEH
ncbi:MAG: bifunctional folylpolyglutamate synthase/dihydrofolate synthase [Gammaproteobacteria bacterium]|jgi:dihydrofolate synthase/folylpolyglutamate synthase|nr:bifunctional folylpolyglutamate synthase/dihydrofolate synthase [Gammaproteobacteria bacterium]